MELSYVSFWELKWSSMDSSPKNECYQSIHYVYALFKKSF